MTKKERRDLTVISRNRAGCVWSMIRFFNFRRRFNYQKMVPDRSDRAAICNKYPCYEEFTENGFDESDQIAENGDEDRKQRSKSIRMLMEEEIPKVVKVGQISDGESKYKKAECHENHNLQKSMPLDVISNQPDNNKVLASFPFCQSQPEIPLNRSDNNHDVLPPMHKIVEGNIRKRKLQLDSENSKKLYIPSQGGSIMENHNTEHYETQTVHINDKHLGTSNDVLEAFLRTIINNNSIKYGEKSLQSQEFRKFLEMLTSEKNLSELLLQDCSSQLEYVHHLRNAQTAKLQPKESCLSEGNTFQGNESESSDLKRCNEPLIPKELTQKDGKVISVREKNVKPSTSDATDQAPNIPKPPTSRTESSSTASISNTLHRSASSLRGYAKNERAVFHLLLQEIRKKVKGFLGKRKKHNNFVPTLSLQKYFYGFYPKDYIKWMQKKIIESHLTSLCSTNARESNHVARIESCPEQDGNTDRTELTFQKDAKKHIIQRLNRKDETIHLQEKNKAENLEQLFLLHEQSTSSSYNDLSSSAGQFTSGNQQSILRKDTSPCIAGTSDDTQGLRDIDQFCSTKGSHSTTETLNLEFLSNAKEKGWEPAGSLDMSNDDTPYQSYAQSPLAKPDLQLPRCYTHIMLDSYGTNQDITAEKSNQPSPISVLELPLLDDIGSPDSTKSEHSYHGKPPRSPRKNQLEDHSETEPTSPFLRLHQEDERSKLSYLRCLLEASGLLRREAWKSRRFHLLNPALFDEVEPPPSEHPVDMWLFFDRTGEALDDIYDRSFTKRPWLGFVEPKIRPLPEGDDLVQEIWRKVGSCGVSEDLRTIDEIVRGDLSVRSWVEAGERIDEIGVAIADEIMEEILDEMVVVMLE